MRLKETGRNSRRKRFGKVNNNHNIIDAYRQGEGGGRVGGQWGIHYYAPKVTNFIFLIVGMVVIDGVFFFANKSTFQGLHNCKFKKRDWH